jgi:hypothetical protein
MTNHPDHPDHPDLDWRTSSFTDRGNCVAVAELDDGRVALRNSNRPQSGTLLLSRPALHAWIAGLKAGEFDDLRSPR